jgi:hypothetical protein
MKNKKYKKIDEKYIYIIDYHYTREVKKAGGKQRDFAHEVS